MCRSPPTTSIGILSIFFWTLTVIISLKYVTLVLRADNHGEGGLVAMLALASQSVKDKPELRRWLLGVGIFGTCLFYGDGVITPAISVLSAVEGLEVVSPELQESGDSAHAGDSVRPVRRAEARHGRHRQVLRPDHAGLVRGHCRCLALSHIASHPEILWAISPHYALGFMLAAPRHHLHHPRARWCCA